MPEHVIDLWAPPSVPDGLTLARHARRSPFIWDPALLDLRVLEEQKTVPLEGHALKRLLNGSAHCSAALLDYLLLNPTIIPLSWRGKIITFWDTEYETPHGKRCVRSLFCLFGVWRSRTELLDFTWHAQKPALVFRSGETQ